MAGTTQSRSLKIGAQALRGCHSPQKPKLRPCRKRPKAAAKPVPPRPRRPRATTSSWSTAPAYIFRAYHALPPLNRKSDGLQVNAVLGFCNMLWKLLRDMPPDNRPTHLAIVFDKSEVTFRNKLYPDYKAHRPPAPDDLIPQFALIREAVRAFDLPCLEQGGFEADDLIATYVREACERGATATIVSSDKDLMQLVTDCVTMYDTMKDRRIGIPEVIEKFGVPPEKVVEVQALAGDTIDNVPGVPGIGIKTAAQLIIEYGDLETLLARAGEIKQPKRREALIENAEKARISRQLVLLDDKVEARRAARRPGGARARCAQADRVPEGDGILHADPPRRRILADRPVGRRSRRQEQQRRQRQVGRLVAAADGAAGGDLFGASGRARAVLRRQRQSGAPGAQQVRRQAEQSNVILRRRRSPPHAPRRRGRRRSIAASIRPSARSTDSTSGSRGRTISATSPSRPRRIRSIRCRRRCRASRWRWRRTTPAISRSPTSNPATAPACSRRASRPTRSRPPTRSRR